MRTLLASLISTLMALDVALIHPDPSLRTLVELGVFVALILGFAMRIDREDCNHDPD